MNDIIKRINKFNKDRNWGQFHSGENLAKSINIEAGELLELFQWSDQVKDIDSLKDELADILIYSIQLVEKYNLDLKEIINDKLQKNEKKYPIEKSYGISKKHNEL